MWGVGGPLKSTPSLQGQEEIGQKKLYFLAGIGPKQDGAPLQWDEQQPEAPPQGKCPP